MYRSSSAHCRYQGRLSGCVRLHHRLFSSSASLPRLRLAARTGRVTFVAVAIFVLLPALADDFIWTQLSTVADYDLLSRGISLGRRVFDDSDSRPSTDDSTKDYVFSVQMRGSNCSNEELGAVGALFRTVSACIAVPRWRISTDRSSVCHGQQEWLLVLVREVLVLEFLSIDTLASGTVSCCEITSLAHETLDDSVERGTLVA